MQPLFDNAKYVTNINNFMSRQFNFNLSLKSSKKLKNINYTSQT